MTRQSSGASALDNLKKKAKRWLKALRAGDEGARARLLRVHPRTTRPGPRRSPGPSAAVTRASWSCCVPAGRKRRVRDGAYGVTDSGTRRVTALASPRTSPSRTVTFTGGVSLKR